MSRQILNTDSFRSHASTPLSPDPDTDILSSQLNISRTSSTPMHSQPFAGGVAPHRDVSALEGEVESLRAELEETKRRMGADLAKAREEALGVMRATGQLPNAVMYDPVVTWTGTGLGLGLGPGPGPRPGPGLGLGPQELELLCRRMCFVKADLATLRKRADSAWTLATLP